MFTLARLRGNSFGPWHVLRTPGADTGWLALRPDGSWKNAGGAFAGGNDGGAFWEIKLDEHGGEVVPSSLRDVLVLDADPRYDLSPKACAGILRRAERRGRILPERLEAALREVVAGGVVLEDYVPAAAAAAAVTTQEGKGADSDVTSGNVIAYQQHGSDVGRMGALRSGHGDVQSGVPFVPYIVNAVESCAKRDHARETDYARCFDRNGSFATQQGGTVIAFNPTKASDGVGASEDYTSALGSHHSRHDGVAVPEGFYIRAGTQNPCLTLDASPALKQGGSHESGGACGVILRHRVRRLTPLECERLQGFEDGWTSVEWRSKPAPDARRYKAIGNAVAVPVIEWLAWRLVAAEMGRDLDLLEEAEVLRMLSARSRRPGS